MSQETAIHQPINPLDSFTITRTLALGRSTVYHAFDTKSNRQVVLKTFPFINSSKLHEGYLSEKAHLKSLKHPHIVQLYEAGDYATSSTDSIEEDVSYLALEYASFGDVLEMVTKYGQVPETLARMMFHQLIDAISYLHRRNVVHMDLKAENLLIDEELNLKLIDFDLSQNMNAAESIKSKGTPGYRSPELIKGVSSDLRSIDVYSAAVVLFILVSGHPPYSEYSRGSEAMYDAYYRLMRADNKKFWEIHAKHKENPAFYSQEFMTLINWMLEEEPEKRATIEDVMNSNWFQGPILSEEEYKVEMKKYLRL